jgi:hypothetical protein
MKMNKIIALALVFLGSAALATGCIEETFPSGSTAILDQKTSSFEDVVGSLPTILVTNYSDVTTEHVNFGYGGIFGGTDRAIGEVFPVTGNMPGGNQYYDRWQPFLYPGSSLGLAPNGWATSFVYKNYYKFIYTTNEVISIASLNESMSTQLGIAKAFRALYYLDLARLYDPLPAKAPRKPEYESQLQGVSGLTVPISREGMALTDYENNPRATRQEIFTFIFEDLDAAEKLRAEYKPATKNFPSLAVVYGLKARAYLWLGGFTESLGTIPTGNEAYTKAAEYARKAIDTSKATIMTEAEWTNPKTGFNTIVSSWMWAMIQSSDTVINNLLSWTAHMAPDAMYGYGYLAQPGMSVFLYDRIANNDFRKKVIVGPDRNYQAIQPYINLTAAQFASTAPYTVFKFKPNQGEKSNDAIGNVTSVPLMRVEEMYLIEAEALEHVTSGGGKALLESFMATRCPGYTAPPSNLVDEIILQKRIEMWGEGVMIYDFKRLNMSMHNGDSGTNAPSGAQFTTDGRAPWWNFVIPEAAEQQNKALPGKNNPNPTQTVTSVK